MRRALLAQFGDTNAEEVLVTLARPGSFLDSLRVAIERAFAAGVISHPYSLDRSEFTCFDESGARIRFPASIPTNDFIFDKCIARVVIRTPDTPVSIGLVFLGAAVTEEPRLLQLSPGAPVVEQLEESGVLGEIISQIEWFGKKVRSANQLRFFRQHKGKWKRINGNNKLWDEGVRESCDLAVKGIVYWEWPPRLLVPPPLTGFSFLTLAILALIVTAYIYTRPKDAYSVEFLSSERRPFFVAYGDELFEAREIAGGEYSARIDGVPKGMQTFLILPKEAPIQRLERLLNSAHAEQRFRIGESKHCRTVKVSFESWVGTVSRPYTLLLNEFPAPRTGPGSAVELPLCPGEYRVSYRGEKGRLIPKGFVQSWAFELADTSGNIIMPIVEPLSISSEHGYDIEVKYQ